jgi:carboxymethylenebutenolidase
VHQFEQELEGAAIPHEIVIYPGAPHSFFDKRAEEFADASADAWTRIQGFIAGFQPVTV